MSNIKQAFGSSGQAFTITIASLTNNSARESTVVDNASNLFFDALVQVKIKSGGSGTSTTGFINIYAYASADGGTNYTEGASGSDAGITLTSPTNLRLIGVLNVVANTTTYKSSPMSVAAAFGGILPEKWGIVIENKTGATLDATGGSHSAFYQGIYSTVT